MAVASGKKNIILATVATVLVAGGVGAYFLATESNTGSESNAALNNVGRGEVKVVPGTSTDVEYNALQEKVNEENYEEAKKAGKTFIPTITNHEAEEDEMEPVIPPQPEPQPEPTPTPVVEPEPIPEPIPVVEPVVIPQPEPVQVPVKKVRYEVEQPASNEGESELEEMYLKEIEMIRNAILNSQNVQVIQASERNFMNQVDADRSKRLEQKTAKENGSAQEAKVEAQQKNSATFVRAGTIVPAEMVTSLSTDEPGPVLAQIVSGPLKGARVIGTVTNAPTDVTDNVQKVTIQFTRIEKDGWRQGYSINAYAIDMDTSRNAVASRVNNHYFRRYGMGTVAALVEGLGEAFSNTQKTVTHTEHATIVQMASDTRNNLKAAMGNVGKQMGREIAKISDVPATIYVDAGASIGLLFMSDF